MIDLAALLLEPLTYPFMVNGLLEMVLLGTASGLVGVFVVHRNLTFFAHALAHTIFPALVLAAALQVAPGLGAAVGALITIALVQAIRRGSPDVGDDSAIGIAFTGLFALGVVLVGLLRVRSRDVGAAVVGNPLGIDTADLAVSAALVLGLAVVLYLVRGSLVLATFDRLGAQAQGLPVNGLDLLLLGMVGITAVVSVSAVGVILTVAVLVTPAATARLWVGSLGRAMLLAGCFGALAGVVGLYVGYYLPVAPSSIVVLALAGLFGISLLVAPRGLLSARPSASVG